MKNKKSTIAIMFCTMGVVFTLFAYAAQSQSELPTASKEEAMITHWRMPEIDKRFRDIKELPEPYISTSPIDLADGILVSSATKAGVDDARLVELAKEIAKGEHGNYDSMLIAKNGALVFESYYKRGRVDLPHPQSSAVKSFTSLVLGRAIQLGYLSMSDLDKPVISFLKEMDKHSLVDGADKITLRHALTMTTGVKISEQGFEAIRADLARIKGQGEIQAILEDSAPILDASQVFKYGVGPQFVMQVIDAVVPGSASAFINQELFAKLGITQYDWRTAPSGLPEAGWEVSITSRDMLKLGLLIRNQGKWKGEQLIDEAYLKEATTRQLFTGDEEVFGGGALVSNQGYGFYFWGTDLSHDGNKHYAFSAQGGGGMYILLVRDYDLIVVVTAHERDDATQQLVAERILPLLAAPSESQ